MEDENTLLLSGKNILIMGIRNKWSIAWGIARAAHREGANIIFTYQGEREKDGAVQLASSLEGSSIYRCDISLDEEIDSLFENIKEKYGVIHGVVHGIAHAKREDLLNSFVETSREGFKHALDVSVYSLIAVCRRAKELMTEGGSIVTLTYMGSEKVFPGYNVMGVAKAALEASVRYLSSDLGHEGIRVNAISAGPIKTISSKAIKDFGNILEVVEQKAPLRKGVTLEDLGNSAVYLLSDLSSGVTGEVIHVDCGYNIMGV
ncbi:MAG TPA: enoyl-ACP reductase [Clostridiaceae bacterium]|nr:enoyl-ACP reductase [Clostridiaceae bacterium]